LSLDGSFAGLALTGLCSSLAAASVTIYKVSKIKD